MISFLKVALLLGAQLTTGYSTPCSTTEQVIKCLDAAKVPQALPSTPEFAMSSKPHNVRLTFTPKAVALPKTVKHVQAAVACGKKLGVKVNARSGGHNYASHGIGGEDGHLILDMKYFDTVKVDPRTQIATVGTGVRLGNLALGLSAQGNRSIPHGVCPKVGVGGHVLHGGWGYSTHNHGLFLDYLEEAEVVLADSSVVTASKTKNPELFWGLRGAGMSFGIATNFKFRTLPEPEELQLFYLPFVWDVPQSAAGWKAFQEYTSSTIRPKEMNIRIVVVSAAGFGLPGTLFLFEGGYHGTRADYEAAIEPFFTAAKKIGGFMGTEVTGIPTVTSVNYLDSLLYVNNNALIGTDSGEQLASTPDEQLQINGYIKSMSTDKLADATVDILMEDMAKASLSNRAWMFIVAAIGGPNSVMSKVPASSTSFAYRDKLLLWEIADTTPVGSPYNSTEGIAFLNNFVDKVTASEKKNKGDKHIGSYYNYCDPELGNHTQAGVHYWGESNYDKLSKLKGRFDPLGVFENPQTVKGKK